MVGVLWQAEAEAGAQGYYLSPDPRIMFFFDDVSSHVLMSNRDGRSPHWEEVQIGDKLPRRVIGPHTIASFTTEYRSFIFNIWGSFRWTAPAGCSVSNSQRRPTSNTGR